MPSDTLASTEDVPPRLAPVRALEHRPGGTFQWAAVDDFLAAEAVAPGLHSILVGGQALELQFAPVPGAPMVVWFQGERPHGEDGPVRDAGGPAAGLAATLLVPRDPALARDPGLRPAWHAGSAAVPLQRLLPAVLEKARRCAQASRLIFCGGSGGGFAALYFASLFPDSVAFVWNPHTDILRCAPADVAAYASSAFGIDSLEEAGRRLPELVCTNVLARHRLRSGARILWLQDVAAGPGADHMLRFMRGFEGGSAWTQVQHLARRKAEGFFGPQRYLCMGQWGGEGGGPSEELLARVLRFLVAHDGDLERLRDCISLDSTALWTDPESLVEPTLATRLDAVRPDWKPLMPAQVEALERDRLILATRLEIQLSDAGEPDWDQSFPSLVASNILWLYSLEYVGALLSRYEESGEVQHLARAMELVASFFRYIEAPANWAAVATNRGHSSVDHAMAIRANVFVKFIQVLRVAGDAAGPSANLLRQCVRWLYRHALWMYADRHYARNNHGVMVDFALIQCARQFERTPWLQEALLSKADERLCSMLQGAFDQDGLCDENTIGYHVFNLDLYRGIEDYRRQSGLGGRFLEVAPPILRKAEHALGLCLWQDGSVPPIGDSPVYRIDTAPINRSKWFRDSHFLVVKNDDLYLSLICGSRSDCHKHVDDSSITLRYRGENILVDGGSYRYDRNDPLRQCVESARGHSGVFLSCLDGMPTREYLLPRTRGRADILSFEEDACASVATCAYTLFDGAVRVERTVGVLWPDEVVLSDRVTIDPHRAPERAVQRLLMGPQLSLQERRDGDRQLLFRGRRVHVAVTHLTGSACDLYRGEEGPPARGWYSEIWQEILPVQGVDYLQEGHQHRFVTVIQLFEGDRPPPSAPYRGGPLGRVLVRP